MAVQLDARSFSSAAQRMLAARRPIVLAGGGLGKPSVISMPSPNHDDRPAGTRIDTIVLHHTASSGRAQDTARYFQNPASEVSSHYIVGKDGTIVQSVADNLRAWHAGESSFKGTDDVNNFSLGIEIVNQGDNRDPYTDAQYDALIKLVAWLVQTYQVPMDRITGHRDVSIPRGRKVDPSNNFDWNRVRRGVEGLLGVQQASAPQPTPQTAPQAAPVVDTLLLSPEARAQAAPRTSRDIQPVAASDVQPFVAPPAQPAIAYAPQVAMTGYLAPGYYSMVPTYPANSFASGTPTPLGTLGTTPGYVLPAIQPAASPTPYGYAPVAYYPQPYAYQAPYGYQQPVAYYQPYAYPQPGYGYLAPGYYPAMA